MNPQPKQKLIRPSWPKCPIEWIIDRILYVSIPFTWNLPEVKIRLEQKLLYWDKAVLGGPAVRLIPDYFKGMQDVTIGYDFQGVLQRINPLATRTTIGCVNKCGFCGVPIFEGEFKELPDWPDLPIICDNNLLAASQKHFDKVINRLIIHGWANFNQGLDARRLTDYHAMRLAEIKEPMLYLALDNIAFRDSWECAYDRLRSAGILKRHIRSYALIGFNSDPGEAWNRCEWIEMHGVKAMPQWFHELNSTEHNIVTEKQMSLGWDDFKRQKIMRWFYKHTKMVRK
jgi:hypothetical protein